MTEEEKKEIESTDEDEKNLDEEKSEEEKKSEEDESKKEDDDDFEKKSENVSSDKYNQALRKQRELEEKLRTAEGTKLDNTKKKVVKKEEEDDDDFFDDEEDDKKEVKPDLIEPISKELKELREKVDAREAEDKTKQRKAFFKAHPEYLKDSEKWQELLDEMDNSLNPNSKDSYFQQLSKAHRLIDEPVADKSAIEKKKAELAAESSNKGDEAKKKDNDKQVDERAMRLAQKMPKGYEFDTKK